MSVKIRGLSAKEETSWDYWFALCYHLTRQPIYSEELEFWRGVCRNKQRVLEIGAGTGFIAKEIITEEIQTLTLVEPEPENIKYLEKISLRNTDHSKVGSIHIVNDIFQNYISTELEDVIYTSWDNLSMFTEEKKRSDIFAHAARLLKKEGQFIFHLSSAKFHESDYNRAKNPIFPQLMLADGQVLKVKFSIVKLSNSLYEKKMELLPPNSSAWLSYSLPTVTVSPEEIHRQAKKNGLKVFACYNSYVKTINADPDDYIWILTKK